MPLSPMGVAIDRVAGPAPAFADLTFPRYRVHLESCDKSIVAFAATLGLRPVGLALVEYHAPEKQAQLLSLVVEGSDRRQGVGSALLCACEDAIAEAECQLLVAYHSSRLPSAPAFQATLRSCGWDRPQVSKVRSAGRSGALASAIVEWPGVRRLLQNPTFSFAPWSTVATADAPAIERLSSELTCCPNMSPTCWTDFIESRVSVAIRRDGEMVGWVLFRVDTAVPEPTLHCDSAYIRRDLWRTGILVAGYLHGYRAVAKNFGPDAIVRFFTGSRMPGMMALTRRRFAPASLWVDDWLLSRKILKRPSLP